MAKQKATTPVEPPPPEPVTTSTSTDWPAAFRSGPDGLRRWNRLKVGERQAVDLSGADLSGLDLTAVKLGGVTALQASFAGAILAGAAMANGRFEKADFSGANLEGAGLVKVQAMQAIFTGAKLAGASLKNGFWFAANFTGANLTGADLTSTNLHAANFTGANLDGVALTGATFDETTRWPAGFAIPAEVIFAGKGTDPRLSGSGKDAVARDAGGLIARLYSVVDPKRRARTLDMLKSGKNELFAEVGPSYIRGIVRSQRDQDLYYSCALTDKGAYACCTPDLVRCMGLSVEPCKHLLVLLIGLARAGKLDVPTVDRWVVAAAGKKPAMNATTRNHLADSLLQYQGVLAGEVDWRPTETIPEDFYAL